MPIVNRFGTVFDTELETIGHGVNCEGKMVAGIAKTVKKLYPSVYQAYVHQCRYPGMRGGDNLAVEALEYEGPGQRWIMNIASQVPPGPHAQYLFLQVGLGKALDTVERLGLYGIALPQIGCGRGKLEWAKTREIIEDASERHPKLTIEIWDFDTKTNE